MVEGRNKMIVYFILLLLLCLTWLIIKKLNIILDKRKYFLIATFLLLTTFASLRSNEIGADLNEYLKIFHATKNYSIVDILANSLSFDHFFGVPIYNGNYEVGYVLLNKLIYTISATDFAFKLFISVFLYIPVLILIYRKSENVFLSVLLYILLGYYLGSYVIIRQYCAISIGIFSVLKLDQKKFASAILISLVGILFHKTAIVFCCFVILYCVLKKRNILLSKKTVILSVLVAYLLSGTVVNFIIQNYYQYYENAIVRGEGVYLFFFLLFLFLVCVWLEKNKKIYDLFFFLALAAVIIQLFSTQFSLITRLGLYFQIYLIVFMANALNQCNINVVKICILVILLLYFGYNLLNDQGSVRKYNISENITLVSKRK